MANFEAFCWTKKLISNPFFLKSAIRGQFLAGNILMSYFHLKSKPTMPLVYILIAFRIFYTSVLVWNPFRPSGLRIVVPREKREIEELLYEKFLMRKWGTRNEKSIFFIFNQNLAFFDDFSKFQIVLSIFHFYKAGKNEKKVKKRLANNSSSKKYSLS